MLKKLIEQYAPSPLLNLIYKIYQLIIYRTKPRITSPLEELDSLSCMIAYNKYGGYCLPLNSIQRPALQATLRGRVWEDETVDFLRSNCQGGDIVHAGTYFGDFLPALSQACDDNRVIWAFEPNPENFLCAQITCLINRLENINLHNAGLGETDESGIMNTIDAKGRSMGGSSTIIDSNSSINLENTEEVRIVSLDALIPNDRHISILQLDVEGYEKQALLGALDLIKRCLPVLIIETLPDVEWLEENLFSIGYVITGVVQKNSILQKQIES